jgi:hypothetical protein
MFSTQDITKMHKHLEQEYSGVTYSAIVPYRCTIVTQVTIAFICNISMFFN